MAHFLQLCFFFSCTENFTGVRCEKPVRGARNLDSEDGKPPNAITVGILIAVTVLLLLLLVIAGAYFVVIRLRRYALLLRELLFFPKRSLRHSRVI